MFADDDSPAARIIRTTGDDIVGGNSYDVPSTPNWHRGSMVLVGDAAHAASPAAGQGASMAIEDSVVLAKCLRDFPDAGHAFRMYELLRRERVERLVAASAEQGSNATPGPVRRMLRDPVVPVLPGFLKRRREGSRAWLYGYHIDWDAPVTLPGR